MTTASQSSPTRFTIVTTPLHFPRSQQAKVFYDGWDKFIPFLQFPGSATPHTEAMSCGYVTIPFLKQSNQLFTLGFG
ncbi:hypothetical protein [Corynebacterium endometrii]|uniref:hypothetical protein n=1 Tax=Corynebacterium endometrii TaxID=2488819 RepID=UPI0014471FF7|nr:hypothetical protein [Corynebacterium endometrii]